MSPFMTAAPPRHNHAELVQRPGISQLLLTAVVSNWPIRHSTRYTARISEGSLGHEGDNVDTTTNLRTSHDRGVIVGTCPRHRATVSLYTDQIVP